MGHVNISIVCMCGMCVCECVCVFKKGDLSAVCDSHQWQSQSHPSPFYVVTRVRFFCVSIVSVCDYEKRADVSIKWT